MAAAGNVYRHDYEDVCGPICLGNGAAFAAAVARVIEQELAGYS